METINIINSGAALLFVLCLIGLFSIILRKFGAGSEIKNIKGEGTITITEIKKLDQKNKLVSVEKNGKEYLLLLSNDGNVLLDQTLDKKDKK